MKKYVKFTPIVIAVLGGVAALLRLWLNGTADENGLLSDIFAPRLCLWLVSLAAAGLTVVVAWPLKGGKKYAPSFPRSMFAAVGMGLSAVLFGICAVISLFGARDVLGILNGIIGLPAAAVLLLAARSRYVGEKPNAVLMGLVCVSMIFWLLDGFRSWGSMPQLDLYLFPLLASISLMLASYQDAAFCIGMGKRRWQALTHLAALYFCLGAIPGSANVLIYLGGAIWMGVSICSLRRKK